MAPPRAAATMLRFFILRIVLPVLLFLLLRSVFKSLAGSLSSATRTQPRQPATGGELQRDPVCGTFVPVSTSITKTVNGQQVHFCSTACRDKYSAA